MDILSNSAFEFIISISLTLISIGINIWFTVRQVGEMPFYECVSFRPAHLADANAKQRFTHLHISQDQTTIPNFYFLTFRLSNIHKEPLTFDEKKPLIIAFPKIPILACEGIHTFPEDLEYAYHIEQGNLFLRVPRLERKESLTLRIVVPQYVYSFPNIRIRGRAPKPTMKANNVRRSKELFVMGILYLCGTVYLFFTTRTQTPPLFHSYLWLFVGGGLLFLGMSWVDRRMPPSQLMLPSQWFYMLFIMFLSSLRVFIPIGIVGFVVYLWFGDRVLSLLFLLSIMTFVPFGAWYTSYTSIIGWRKKKHKKYNPLIIGVVTGIPLIAFYILCASVIIDILLHW